MKAGFARRDITPPVDTPFGCFATERHLPVVGHHDPLWARAFAVTEGENTVALVSCDLAVNMSWVVREARARTEKRTGIPGHNVMVSHTHVHSAPGGVGVEAAAPGVDPDWFGEPEYVEKVVEGVAGAVEDALADQEECAARVTRQPIEGIGTTRDRRDPPYQPFAGLLEFDTAKGVKGVAISYACHPSIVGFTNLLTSSDYVGAACDTVSEALGGAGAVLLMAPAGDVSTRNTRREQTFAEVDRLGKALAAQLLAVRDRLEPVAFDAVESLNVRCDVPVGPLPTNEDLEKAVARTRAALDKAIAESPDAGSGNQTYNMPMGLVLEMYVYWQRARKQLEKMASVRVTSTPSEIQVIRMGPVCFLGVECELHTPREEEIRDAIPDPLLFIVAPANGSLGNVGGKSKNGGILATPAGDTLVAAAVDLTKKAMARRV